MGNNESGSCSETRLVYWFPVVKPTPITISSGTFSSHKIIIIIGVVVYCPPSRRLHLVPTLAGGVGGGGDMVVELDNTNRFQTVFAYRWVKAGSINTYTELDGV